MLSLAGIPFLPTAAQEESVGSGVEAAAAREETVVAGEERVGVPRGLVVWKVWGREGRPGGGLGNPGGGEGLGMDRFRGWCWGAMGEDWTGGWTGA